MSENKSKNLTNSTQTTIYKSEEFAAFVKTLEFGKVEHWQDIAEAIGVDRKTINEWRKLPEAQEARKKGIDRALASMEQAGAKDWRMWREKLTMLGFNPENSDKPATVNVIQMILNKYGVFDEEDKPEQPDVVVSSSSKSSS